MFVCVWGGGGGGGGGGVTLIFSYIQQGLFLGVQDFGSQYYWEFSGKSRFSVGRVCRFCGCF